jgi:hypothetical protein
MGSTFRASRQDVEALMDHFVVFCQLLSGCGWKRWSNEAIYKRVGLVNDYRVQYFYRSPVNVTTTFMQIAPRDEQNQENRMTETVTSGLTWWGLETDLLVRHRRMKGTEQIGFT